MAYWSTAESIRRRSFKTRLACARLRARRNPGTAIAANKAMIATTIMISTRVKPPRRLLILLNMFIASFVWFDCAPRFRGRDLFRAVLMPFAVLFRISGLCLDLLRQLFRPRHNSVVTAYARPVLGRRSLTALPTFGRCNPLVAP